MVNPLTLTSPCGQGASGTSASKTAYLEVAVHWLDERVLVQEVNLASDEHPERVIKYR